MEELKSCKCGGNAKLIEKNYGRLGGSFYGVRCEKCQKLQTFIDDKADAIAAWNTRAGAER